MTSTNSYPGFPPIGGGGGSSGGAVSSVTGSAGVTVSPTTGAVVVSGASLAPVNQEFGTVYNIQNTDPNPYTLGTNGEHCLLVGQFGDWPSYTMTINLPQASTVLGQTFVICNGIGPAEGDGNTLAPTTTIAPYSGDLINGQRDINTDFNCGVFTWRLLNNAASITLKAITGGWQVLNNFESKTVFHIDPHLSSEGGPNIGQGSGEYLPISCAGSNITCQLQSGGPVNAYDSPGQIAIFVKTDSSANTLTIHCVNSATINDGTTDIVITQQWEAVMLCKDNAYNWNILAHYYPNNASVQDHSILTISASSQTVSPTTSVHYLVNLTANSTSITIPTASAALEGMEILFIRTDSNVISYSVSFTNTIYGIGSPLTVQYSNCKFKCINSNWFRIQ